MKRAALMLLAAAVVVVAYSCGETEPPENRPPRAVGAIPAQEVMAFDTVQLDLSQYFADDDGDNLSYSATSGTPRVVRVAVSGSTLLIIGRERGAAAVTVVARDPDGLWATQNISVEVLGTPGFLRLELHYDEVDIGAVVLLLEGPPADSIQAADGLTLYRAPAEGGVRAFVAGPIPVSGTVFRFWAEDIASPQDYQGILEQAAGSDYRQRGAVERWRVRIVR
ncbi:MAG: hypothetical protein F4139_13220 [Gemmatimonadetes bacterium]|nr:hypothetical protein [Gemmatimonadota bacterium]MYA64833.1 hypothetical protein [Gemmatimonadota bacterium]MYB97354.1 hypothetical protein [Gemmatimonadota bacterium]MYH53883.1 hypothetical protein [Gemmatimonadota bacterium]MYI47336.1 hypothetical protein [Gemmatimonadota bacterium]